MGGEGLGPRVAFYIGDIPVSETVTVTWLIMFLILVFSLVATRNMKKEAKGIQVIAETLVGVINKLTKDTMGERHYKWAPYIGTLLIFIALANIIGLLGLRPPTADLNTTVCLSSLTFMLAQIFGIKNKGLKEYANGFMQPIKVILPLNIIGEVAKPISLGFRLFGSITAGIVIMTLLYGALGGLTEMILGVTIPFLQAGLPSVLHIYFDLFAGLIQSFIFTMLTMVFISGSME